MFTVGSVLAISAAVTLFTLTVAMIADGVRKELRLRRERGAGRVVEPIEIAKTNEASADCWVVVSVRDGGGTGGRPLA